MVQTPVDDAPRSRRARQVSALMPKVGGAAFRRYGFMQSSIVAEWAQIVGADYARHSAPETIVFPQGKRSGATLRIAVTGAFAPLLKHVEPQVIERVNRFFGYAAVARLALRHADAPPPEVVEIAPLPAPLAAETRASLRAIADPGLRDALTSLAQAMSSTRGPPKIG